MVARPEPPRRGPLTDAEFEELKRRTDLRFAWRNGFLTCFAIVGFLAALAWTISQG